MRIAAGVLLIVAAILNVGCTWAGAGACTGCVGEVLDQNRLQEENHRNEADSFCLILLYPIEEESNETDGNDAESGLALVEDTDQAEDYDDFEPPSQETIEELKPLEPDGSLRFCNYDSCRSNDRSSHLAHFRRRRPISFDYRYLC